MTSLSRPTTSPNTYFAFACKPRCHKIGLHLRMERGLSSKPASAAGVDCADGLDDFDSIVRLHRPRIFRFMLASLRDREAAENLTQDCFVNAYKARAHFRGACSIGTWFMQIAANLIRDHESSSRLKFWRRTLQPDVDLADLGDSIPDRQMSPEALALAKEQVTAIWNAAALLPNRQRTVFLLRFVEDMDLLEIAEVTGMKEGTVKTHLFRALQSVRARLEGNK
jgi:RNA polymerase sigma-70 factor, ECF subfamily